MKIGVKYLALPRHSKNHFLWIFSCDIRLYLDGQISLYQLPKKTAPSLINIFTPVWHIKRPPISIVPLFLTTNLENPSSITGDRLCSQSDKRRFYRAV